MAMVKCPECGGDVSTQAFACPKCGAARVSRPVWGRVLILLALGAGLFYWLSTQAPAWDAQRGAPAETSGQ